MSGFIRSLASFSNISLLVVFSPRRRLGSRSNPGNIRIFVALAPGIRGFLLLRAGAALVLLLALFLASAFLRPLLEGRSGSVCHVGLLSLTSNLPLRRVRRLPGSGSAEAQAMPQGVSSSLAARRHELQCAAGHASSLFRGLRPTPERHRGGKVAASIGISGFGAKDAS